MRHVSRSVLVSVGVLALTGSCGDPLSIDVHSPDGPPVVRPPGAVEELRRSQLLRYEVDGELVEEELFQERVLAPTSLGEVQGTSAEASDQFMAIIGTHCDAMIWSNQNPGGEWAGQSRYFYTGQPSEADGNLCTVLLDRTTYALCQANTLEELASSTSAVSLRAWDSDGVGQEVQIVVPPQSSISRAGLHEIALRTAQEAIRDAEELTGPNWRYAWHMSDCTGSTSAVPQVPGIQLFLLHATELYELSTEAAEAAVTGYLAVADSAAARSADGVDAARSRRELRLHAARLLGGGIGQLDDETMGACSSPALAGGTRKAVDLIRRSGMLVEPGSTSDVGDFVDEMIDRLAVVWAQESLVADLTRVEFLALHGLSENDFVAARDYLADQTLAFVRSRTQVYPDESLPFIRYAATVNPPESPNAMVYSAFSRSGEWPRGDQRLADVALANGAMNLRRLLANVAAAPGGLPAFSGDAANRALAVVESELLGELTLKIDGGNLIFEVQMYGPVSNPIVARGADSLACATRAVIEGVRCTWAQVQKVPRDMSAGLTYSVPFTEDPLYFLVLKEGASPNAPGAYEAIAGYRVPPRYSEELVAAGQDINSVSATLDVLPITPAIDRRVGEIMTPSTEWCVQPATSCAGFAFDARLPLEDELTDDGDAYENSWRRYLTLARQAANEADLLGQEALQATLDIDQRAEASVEELEDICGVSINIDPIAAAREVEPGMSPVEAAASLVGQQSSAAALADCLGTDAVVNYVGVGQKELCAWYVGNPSTGFCEGATDDFPCPGFPTPSEDESGCDVPAALEATATPVLIHGGEDGIGGGQPSVGVLGLIDPPVQTADTEMTESFCKDVRTLRRAAYANTYAAVANEWGAVFHSAQFSPENVASLAYRLRWEAEAGSHSAVYADDNVLVTTGTVRAGFSASGLCGTGSDLPDDCVEDDPSLFCRTGGCSTDLSRAILNTRLVRAAAFARWLGQTSLQGFRVPDFQDEFPGGKRRDDLNSFIASNGWSGGEFTDSTQLGSEAAAVHYCYNGRDDTIWRFNRGPLSGVPSFLSYDHAPSTDCFDTDAIRITTLTGDRAYGRNGVSQRVIDRNHRRAVEFLDTLRRLAGSQTEGPMASLAAPLSSPSAGTISTACQSCGDSNESSFPWIESVETNDPVAQTRRPGVRFFFPRNTLDVSETTFFDALELLCEAGVARSPNPTIDIGMVSSENQLPQIARRFDAAAEQFNTIGNKIVLQDVPTSVFRAVRSAAPLGGTSTLGGQFGAATLRFRAAVIDLSALPGQLGNELKGIARDVRQVENALRRAEIDEDQLDINFRKQVVQQLTNCAAGMTAASGASAGGPTSWGSGGAELAAAAIVCANSFAQIGFAARERSLQRERLNTERVDVFLGFEEKVASRGSNLELLGLRLRASANELQAALEDIKTLRDRGNRVLSRALFLDSDDTGRVFRTNTTLRRRLATTSVRYQRARRDAIKMAFLARRAIEQRFGVSLATMDQDMTLVAAPSTWESRLCELEGIDYAGLPAEIRDESVSRDDFTEEFIGSYVSDLENFVESYRIDFPFQNGQDTAVVSLRDDVHNVRALCAQPADNELYHSTSLRVEPSADAPGWLAYDCQLSTLGPPLPNCAAVSAIPLVNEGDWPEVEAEGAHGTARPYRFQFGGSHPLCPGTDCPCEGFANCGWRPEASYGQELELGAGVYRASWYGKPAMLDGVMGEISDAIDAVSVVGLESGLEFGPLSVASGSSATAGGDWARYWFVFRLPSREFVRFQVRAARGVPSAVDIAGPMIERMGPARYAVDPAIRPAVFAETGATLEHPLQVCEDSDGTVFRDRSWRRNCVRLCATGFGDACSPETSVPACYYETEFTISQRAIERGEIFTRAGFARGNFNYRIDQLALNFVGTGTRSCEDTDLPATCANAGFIPYTLEHLGPHHVRNALGENQEAYVFRGYIEHARGLAAERYLTNPLSSGDRALIEPYMQRQFRGRPLTGTYRLRVWEEPGVSFDGIEDVQILLGYRYWTRFD